MRSFAEFVAKKEAEAAAARLSAWRTDLDAAPPHAMAIGNAWTRRLFDGDFYVSRGRKDRPSTSLVFVQSHDGNTGAANPSSLGGGETDKHVVYEGLSRAGADAVLAGAGTIRGGRIVLSVWHPELVRLRASLDLPRHPIQIVATLRGLPFEESLLFNVPELRVVLLTIPSWAALMHEPLAARPWITPVVMETPDDLPSAFEQLRALGIERISCIGGRTLAGQLLDAQLIDDVYLTTAPKPGGEPNTPLPRNAHAGHIAVRKHGTGSDAGVTFEQRHLAFEPSARPAPL
jgi:riboflavin biosynthesis pyrimidine reductase